LSSGKGTIVRKQLGSQWNTSKTLSKSWRNSGQKRRRSARRSFVSKGGGVLGQTPHPNDKTDLGTEANPASKRDSVPCVCAGVLSRASAQGTMGSGGCGMGIRSPTRKSAGDVV
jgi:hypothetical protein